MKLGLAMGAGSAINNTALAADIKKSSSLIEADVTGLQALMESGKLTASALTEHYLERIKAIDKSGPRINAIIELNPDALAIAKELDKERKASGARGALHGIPVLIKDNIATADRMQTTAGSLALVGAKAPRDAFLVKQLRDAGAIILGKTNLSEWANYRGARPVSGWSGVGGWRRLRRPGGRPPPGVTWAWTSVEARVARRTIARAKWRVFGPRWGDGNWREVYILKNGARAEWIVVSVFWLAHWVDGLCGAGRNVAGKWTQGYMTIVIFAGIIFEVLGEGGGIV